jgi:hypothetical protein
MPICHRCGRMQPRGELRKTSLGFVCLEGGELGRFSRCFAISSRRGDGSAAAATREVGSPVGAVVPSVSSGRVLGSL